MRIIAKLRSVFGIRVISRFTESSYGTGANWICAGECC